VIETECLWNRNISRKKPVLKHGSYPALTKHGSITDRAVLEQLSLISTSGYLSSRVQVQLLHTDHDLAPVTLVQSFSTTYGIDCNTFQYIRQVTKLWYCNFNSFGKNTSLCISKMIPPPPEKQLNMQKIYFEGHTVPTDTPSLRELQQREEI
jgi:hypothetical protein